MPHFTQMIDMAKTASDVKKEATEMPMAAKPSVPVYPYGLCLSLDEDTMGKLDIAEKPDVGAMIHLAAMAKTTHVSESESEDTEGNRHKHCRVELQITHLATENEDDEAAEEAAEARRGRWYGKAEPAEEIAGSRSRRWYDMAEAA